jgi:hypothetical protein
MEITSDEDNYWGFSAWVIQFTPWQFASIVYAVEWNRFALGFLFETSGFIQLNLWPVRLSIYCGDSRNNQMSKWYGWKKGDPYPADDNEEV